MAGAKGEFLLAGEFVGANSAGNFFVKKWLVGDEDKNRFGFAWQDVFGWIRL